MRTAKEIAKVEETPVADDQGYDIVWTPHWGSQADALSCPADEILYHGTRGPGKTDAQIMRFVARVGLGYGKHWRGIILDVEYKNLDDIVAKCKRWIPLLNDGARWLSSPADYKWVWPTGEELLLRQMKDKRDYAKYHGHEYPYIGWNELTKQAVPEAYDLMLSCNRSSFIPEEDSPDPSDPLPPIPLEIFNTTNPHGLGHNWVHSRFVKNREAGEIYVESMELFNPRTQRMETVERTQCHIFGSWRENDRLDPGYIARLMKIRDPNRRKAWLMGDWNIVAGGAIDDLWDESVHVIPRLIVPRHWRVDRSFDWGSSAPFYNCWWAEANGEECVLADGRKWCPPAGTLIMVNEWFGVDEKEYERGNVYGLKLPPKKLAQGILKREREELLGPGWVKGEVLSGPADNQIREIKVKDTETIEKAMADQGVRWTESDKTGGSRIIGLDLFRAMLQASLDKDEEVPGIYFTSNCKYAIEILPMLPRDPDNEEDVDTKYPLDHPWDAVRYRVLKGKNRLATSLELDFPT